MLQLISLVLASFPSYQNHLSEKKKSYHVTPQLLLAFYHLKTETQLSQQDLKDPLKICSQATFLEYIWLSLPKCRVYTLSQSELLTIPQPLHALSQSCAFSVTISVLISFPKVCCCNQHPMSWRFSTARSISCMYITHWLQVGLSFIPRVFFFSGTEME